MGRSIGTGQRMGEGLVSEWTSFGVTVWKVAAETGQGMGEGLVSEKTTLEGLFEGLSRDCSGRWRDWSQNRLVLRKYELEGRSRDWSERWRDWSRNGLVGGSVLKGRSRD